MASRVRRVMRWVAYPLCYLFFLGLFLYWSFPFDRIGDRIIAEFDRASARDARRSGGEPMKLSLGSIDGYWLSGVEVHDAELVVPAKKTRGSSKMAAFNPVTEAGATPKPMSLRVDRATARVELLPLLLGKVRIRFEVDAFGGSVQGTVPYGPGSGDVELEVEGLQLANVGPLKSMLDEIPLLGVVSGTLRLEPKDGKFAKASGELAIEIDKVVLGDGKAKIQGVALPAAQVGRLTLAAKAKDGVLEIEELSAQGRDFVLAGDGKIKLHESWKRTVADVHLRFKFTDAYRDSDDATRGLLGKPGETMPPLIELGPSPFKRAKRDDGMYGFYVHGPLGRIDADPQPERSSARSRRKRGKRGGKARLPFAKRSRKRSSKRTPTSGARDGAASGSDSDPRDSPRAPKQPGNGDGDRAASGAKDAGKGDE